MIRLRELKPEDAPLMLEWMHDPDVIKGFKKNMLNASLDDAVRFCTDSKIPEKIVQGASLHFAIADDNDEYLGTISLKNIDIENGNAEYAITTRKITQGRGVAYTATGLLLKKAFTEYGLHRVYLSVFADNDSAIRLYEKIGFKPEGQFRDHLKINGKFVDWKWYGILSSEFDQSVFELNSRS